VAIRLPRVLPKAGDGSLQLNVLTGMEQCLPGSGRRASGWQDLGARCPTAPGLTAPAGICLAQGPPNTDLAEAVLEVFEDTKPDLC